MVRRAFFISAVLLPLLTVLAASQWLPALWAFVIWVPLIATGLHDVRQTRHSLLRIYPVIGHGRFMMEAEDRQLKLGFRQCPITQLGLKQSTQHFREISLLGKDTAMFSEGAG